MGNTIPIFTISISKKKQVTRRSAPTVRRSVVVLSIKDSKNNF